MAGFTARCVPEAGAATVLCASAQRQRDDGRAAVRTRALLRSGYG